MMSKLTFVASCAVSAHYALLFYSLVSRIFDPLLYVITFITGTISILFYSMDKEIYENKFFFLNTIIAGVTTFNSSIFISQLYPIAEAIFKWTIAVAFNVGSLRTMKLVEGNEIAKRNLIYLTLTLILNIIYILL